MLKRFSNGGENSDASLDGQSKQNLLKNIQSFAITISEQKNNLVGLFDHAKDLYDQIRKQEEKINSVYDFRDSQQDQYSARLSQVFGISNPLQEVAALPGPEHSFAALTGSRTAGGTLARIDRGASKEVALGQMQALIPHAREIIAMPDQLSEQHIQEIAQMPTKQLQKLAATCNQQQRKITLITDSLQNFISNSNLQALHNHQKLYELEDQRKGWEMLRGDTARGASASLQSYPTMAIGYGSDLSTATAQIDTNWNSLDSKKSQELMRDMNAWDERSSIYIDNNCREFLRAKNCKNFEQYFEKKRAEEKRILEEQQNRSRAGPSITEKWNAFGVGGMDLSQAQAMKVITTRNVPDGCESENSIPKLVNRQEQKWHDTFKNLSAQQKKAIIMNMSIFGLEHENADDQQDFLRSSQCDNLSQYVEKHLTTQLQPLKGEKSWDKVFYKLSEGRQTYISGHMNNFGLNYHKPEDQQAFLFNVECNDLSEYVQKFLSKKSNDCDKKSNAYNQGASTSKDVPICYDLVDISEPSDDGLVGISAKEK